MMPAELKSPRPSHPHAHLELPSHIYVEVRNGIITQQKRQLKPSEETWGISQRPLERLLGNNSKERHASASEQ
jgi:hypothetical protein